jgi:hypothetical protein
VFGSQTIEPDGQIAIETEIDHARWLVWPGKGRRSVSRIKALDATLLAKDGYEYSTLYWNLRRLYFYIENNAHTLLNYGTRCHKGLPNSSGIAESAVKLVVSHRMARSNKCDGQARERTAWQRSGLLSSRKNFRFRRLPR